MTTRQKLELTWIGKENRPRLEPRIRLEFLDDPQREDSPVRCHEAILGICHEPRCRCSNIRFQWLSALVNTVAAPARTAREFWFNLNEKSILLTPELEKDPESLRLLKYAEFISSACARASKSQSGQTSIAGKTLQEIEGLEMRTLTDGESAAKGSD